MSIHDAANAQYARKSRCQVSGSVSGVLSWWNVRIERAPTKPNLEGKLQPWLRTRVQRFEVWKVIKKNIDSHRVAFAPQKV